MKRIDETIAAILFVVFILALIFLLEGKPSVWDRLHDAAIGVCK